MPVLCRNMIAMLALSDGRAQPSYCPVHAEQVGHEGVIRTSMVTRRPRWRVGTVATRPAISPAMNSEDVKSCSSWLLYCARDTDAEATVACQTCSVLLNLCSQPKKYTRAQAECMLQDLSVKSSWVALCFVKAAQQRALDTVLLS